MKKNYKIIGVVSILLIVFIYFFVSYVNGGKKELKKNNTESIFAEEDVQKISTDKEESIVVEIKGEVSKPDVYYMSSDSIVEDLIKEAGGLTANASVEGINRAKALVNHECIVIPNKNAPITNAGLEQSSQTSGGKVNINTADESELDTLPGIGPSRAKDIIKYREQNGGFKSIDELKNVSGIGDASYEKLKDSITT